MAHYIYTYKYHIYAWNSINLNTLQQLWGISFHCIVLLLLLAKSYSSREPWYSRYTLRIILAAVLVFEYFSLLVCE